MASVNEQIAIERHCESSHANAWAKLPGPWIPVVFLRPLMSSVPATAYHLCCIEWLGGTGCRNEQLARGYRDPMVNSLLVRKVNQPAGNGSVNSRAVRFHANELGLRIVVNVTYPIEGLAMATNSIAKFTAGRGIYLVTKNQRTATV
jgi:hypothetical protein